MTCIVGLEHDGSVYIGGDSASSDTESSAIGITVGEKVFVTDDGEFIIGFSGSFRIGQLLRYSLVIPDRPSKKSDIAYLVTDFVDAVRDMHKDKGTMQKQNEEEQHDSAFLLGYNGKLYTIESDFHVSKTIENYSAVGSGAQIALGALYATKKQAMMPEERIMLALQAAAEYDAAVRQPFHIIKLATEE